MSSQRKKPNKKEKQIYLRQYKDSNDNLDGFCCPSSLRKNMIYKSRDGLPSAVETQTITTKWKYEMEYWHSPQKSQTNKSDHSEEKVSWNITRFYGVGCVNFIGLYIFK